MKITDTYIKNLKARDRDYMVGLGHTLWLRVRSSGSKVFILRRKIDGKPRVITLGNYPTLTLQDARRKSFESVTPLQKDVKTVESLCNEFFDRIISPRYRRPHHVRGYLNKLISQLGGRKVRDITRAELADFIKEYALRGKVAANRMLAIMRQAFGYAVEAGFIDQSPAAGITRRIAGGDEKTRERILTDAEIRLVWEIPAPHGPLLRFLILTGQRIGEAQKAAPTHIEGDIWQIPAENAKNNHAHSVYLSLQAKAQLTNIEDNRNYCFGVTSDTAVQAYLRRWCDRNNINPRFTPHDLRRTASTRMHELGAAPHVVEKILNHSMQGVMAVYNRAEYFDERKAALISWGEQIVRINAAGDSPRGTL